MRRFLLAAVLAVVAAECRAADEREPTLDGKPLSAWAALLKEGNYEDRAAAAAALMRMGKDARPAAPALIDIAANDPIFRIRRAAVEALGEIGPEAKEVIPALTGLLRESSSWEVRATAAAALAKCGPEAKEAVPALREAAVGWKAEVRREAAKALGRIEASAWTQGEKYGDVDARLRSAAALGRLDPAEAEFAVPVLVMALRDPDAKVRRAGAVSLARLGEGAKGAMPALRDVLEKEKDPAVRTAVAAALDALEKTPQTAAAAPLLFPQNTEVAAAPLAPAVAAGPAHAAPLAEKYLLDDQLADGAKALQDRLKEDPKDDQARFGLGVLKFFQSVEHLGQSLHRYGLRSDRGRQMNIPFLRLPVPVNADPDTLTYPALRQVLQDLIDDLRKAEDTLADVRDDDVKLPLRLGRVRLNFGGGAKEDVRVLALLSEYMSLRPGQGNDDLLVVFDRGDVAWLRGYCHLLMAMSEAFLAYDGQELFDCTGHIFFAKADTAYPFLKEGRTTPYWNVGDGVDVIDLIALIHVIRLPVKEPERMKAALAHLEKVIALSRESWKYILAETDDDHEWIPNPRQTGALGVKVTQEMVDGWTNFLDETDSLLAGKRLVPFWRGRDGRGINLRRVFTEPRPFDLVLWVQGTAAAPYLEKGEVTRPEVWARLQRVFQGQFIGFAFYFN